MRKCPDCGFEFDDDKSFCPSCGKYMPRIKNPYPSANENTANAAPEPQPAEPAAAEDIFEEDQPAAEPENRMSITSDVPQQNFEHADEPSTWSFVLTIFLLSIPAVGLIYAIVLACGGTKYEAKKHLARAVFLYNFILLVLISAAVLVLMLTMGEDAFVMLVNNLIGITVLG